MGCTQQVTVPEGNGVDDISGMTITFCPSTDEAAGLGVHDYRLTVPGLKPTTPGEGWNRLSLLIALMILFCLCLCLLLLLLDVFQVLQTNVF